MILRIFPGEGQKGNLTMFPTEVQDFFAELTEEQVLDAQYEMAVSVLKYLVANHDKVGDISPLALLDCLGSCGLSLTISEVASLAHIRT